MPAKVDSVVCKSREYQARIMRATHGSLTAGSNTYADHEEWAEFDNLGDAQRADRLLRQIGFFYA